MYVIVLFIFSGEVICRHFSTSNTAMEMDRIGARPVGGTHDSVCPSTTAGMKLINRFLVQLSFLRSLRPPKISCRGQELEIWEK